MRFAMTGFLWRRSMRIPKRVLMRERPSAPASWQALAMGTMSVTLGLSFIYTGFLVTAFTALVTWAAASGLTPKLIPPWSTLGQLTFTSRMPTCSEASRRRQASAYSSTEKPPTLAMTFFL